MFKLEFSEQDVNRILQALGEMPAKMSMLLINDIQVQCQRQISKEKEREESE